MSTMKLRNIISIFALSALIFTSCDHPVVPADAVKEDRLPQIQPDRGKRMEKHA